MIDLPIPDKCPLVSDGVCTCDPPKTCKEMDYKECSAIRVAYCYGCNKTEIEIKEKIKTANGTINAILEMLLR